MDLAGGEFWASDTFLTTGAAVGAAILIGIATIWATLWVGNTRRRLFYSMPVITPLLNDRPDMPDDIEVRRAGQLLKSPHVVNVELTSRGRLDIARGAFDGGEPLRLDVGAPIVDCLAIITSPPDRPDPAWKTDGSGLLVGPSLIGRRQTTVFSLLVDGPSPCLGPARQTLTDVTLLPAEDSGREAVRILLALAMSLAALVLLLLIAKVGSVPMILAALAGGILAAFIYALPQRFRKNSGR